MPVESTRPLARRIFRVVLGSRDVADADLLRRFASSRDEEAFAELVRRHGPMVLGVCRRVTGHPHDAEDAFQAAFIVLARRAGHLKHPEQLANWLYGVAYRTALEARAARRRVQEQPVSAAPEPAAPDEPDNTDDLRRVIDEELSRLPEKYRSAVVLCDLEGASRAEAAERLSIPEGTLSSRLAHARKVLSERLSRRGVTASALAVAASLGRDAVAAVPRDLVTLTARVASRATAGGAASSTLIAPNVSSLADGVMKAMLVNRLRLALAAVVACGLLGLGAYGLAQVPAPATANNPFVPQDVPAVVPNVVIPNFDPLTGDVFIQQDGQPAKQPKKVAPKGIEDDDVPYAHFPSQAVVRVEDDKLIVRQRGYRYQVSTVTVAGGQNTATAYQLKSGVNATTHDLADIAVFDMKGNRLQPKAWKEKFKVDVHVLVSSDGKLPNPRELALLKEDTLIVILPGHVGPAFAAPPAPVTPTLPRGYTVPSGQGVYYPPVPSTTTPAPPASRNIPPQPGTPAIPPPARTPRTENIPPPVDEVPPAYSPN
jgi:RNA polymerase sigma factor (sigma-70 family)